MSRQRDDSTVDLDLTKLAESASAYKLTDGDHESWVPKEYAEEIDEGEYRIAEWVAVDRGWA